GRPPALEVLCRLFGLNGFERDVVMLCAAAEMDPAFGRLYAYVQDDVHLRHATIPLALQLFCDSDAMAHVARRCFGPEPALRRYCLLTTAAVEPVAQCLRPLRIDDRILDYVGGCDRMDERAADLLQPVAPIAITAEQGRAVGQLAQVLQGTGQRRRYGGVSL